MKNMVLLLCILFLCSWAETDAQDFHLQPTPQKYVGSEDSISIPAKYSLQVGAAGKCSGAVAGRSFSGCRGDCRFFRLYRYEGG